jgi:hypothetical protein
MFKSFEVRYMSDRIQDVTVKQVGSGTLSIVNIPFESKLSFVYFGSYEIQEFTEPVQSS